jgi:hypothetical protein
LVRLIRAGELTAVWVTVRDEHRAAPVQQTMRDRIGQSRTPRGLPEHDKPVIGRQITGILRRCERL